MLSVLLVLPLLGALLVSVLGNTESMKKVTLVPMVVNFVVAMVMWAWFDANLPEGTYQYTQEFTTGELGFGHLHMGVDGLSLYFVLLTCLIMPISVLANWSSVPDGTVRYFLVCFLVLETLLLAAFTALDLVLFYVFFEAVLIPLFIIVGVYGSGAMGSRIRAAFLLFLYTLFGSLFMLLAILGLYSAIGSTDYSVVYLADISVEAQKVLWLGFFISMVVKTPMVPFNTWLTYAHAEAPVGGSIVLAGVILKLATYLALRVMLQFLPDATHYYAPLVQLMAVVSVLYASLATLRQTDFKKMVAYSSVAHVAVVVLGLFSNTVQGIEGAIMLALAHGVVSPGLFFLVGGVLYDRYHTRTIRYYRGMVNVMPLFGLLFFLFTIFNAAVPLSGNWVGEFMCLLGAYDRNPFIAVLGSLTIVLSAAYSFWLFNRITFGSWSPYLSLSPALDLTRREYMVMLPLLFYSLVLGIWPTIVLNDIHHSVSSLIYYHS